MAEQELQVILLFPFPPRHSLSGSARPRPHLAGKVGQRRGPSHGARARRRAGGRAGGAGSSRIAAKVRARGPSRALIGCGRAQVRCHWQRRAQGLWVERKDSGELDSGNPKPTGIRGAAHSHGAFHAHSEDRVTVSEDLQVYFVRRGGGKLHNDRSPGVLSHGFVNLSTANTFRAPVRHLCPGDCSCAKSLGFQSCKQPRTCPIINLLSF
ncbi:uncharacterized protein LOC123652334 [Pipistrellus kuhlii]|uniref:uncharacterized protein LOC123652334 n=1 Tax=Pipistrellus kuhlii TaxID=59472 RepID=UPI001E272397|nr:uncharacterized protein LOC123652334 [Pipistrellus kuhlii]